MSEKKFSGDKLRTIREGQMMTQTELADKLRVRSSNVSRWEAGTTAPRPRKIKIMAKLFKVETDAFFTATTEN